MSSIDKVNVGGTIYDIKDSNVIDDTATSTDTTWSSSKINTLINEHTTETVNLSFAGLSTQATVKKFGKSCSMFISLSAYTATTFSGAIIANLPEEFRPKVGTYISSFAKSVENWSIATFYPLLITVFTDGTIRLYGNDAELSNSHYIEWTLQWEV